MDNVTCKGEHTRRKNKTNIYIGQIERLQPDPQHCQSIYNNWKSFICTLLKYPHFFMHSKKKNILRSFSWESVESKFIDPYSCNWLLYLFIRILVRVKHFFSREPSLKEVTVSQWPYFLWLIIVCVQLSSWQSELLLNHALIWGYMWTEWNNSFFCCCISVRVEDIYCF